MVCLKVLNRIDNTANNTLQLNCPMQTPLNTFSFYITAMPFHRKSQGNCKEGFLRVCYLHAYKQAIIRECHFVVRLAQISLRLHRGLKTAV